MFQKLMTAYCKGTPNEQLLASRQQTRAVSLRSEDSHHSDDVIDDLKENISPLRANPARTIDAQKIANWNVVGSETAGSYLMIAENMGTPLRRTTFIRDADQHSPKYVTLTPERKIVSIEGFQSSASSLQTVPDCYATPLRRTTFVKNSPKLNPECGRSGKVESNVLFGKVQRYDDTNVLRTEEAGVNSRVFLVAADDLPELASKRFRQHQKHEDPLRDVSRSPLILEDRLLHLQDTNRFDTACDDRPQSTSASSRCSPSESEYHTAVTTPYDESFSYNEDADEFVDSNICSETITGDMSLCQQQLALRPSSDITFITNDAVIIENMRMEDWSKKPQSNSHADHRQADVFVTESGEYEVHTEAITEVVNFEMTEMLFSSHVMETKSDSIRKAGDLNTVVYEHEMAGHGECAGSKQLFSAAMSAVETTDVQRSANLFSNYYTSVVGDGDFSATGYDDSYRRLSSTPLVKYEMLVGTGVANHTAVPPNVDSKLSEAVVSDVDVDVYEEKMADSAAIEKELGVFHIPFDNDISCILNSQTVTKVCATPPFTRALDSCNRTYTKSASGRSGGSLSGSRSANRSLFTDRLSGINSIEDEYVGVVPLDMPRSGFHDTTVTRSDQQPQQELPECDESVPLSRIWSDGEMSIMDRGVISQVGGPTWHMISPGQKRQSLIARLHADRQHHLTQSDVTFISNGLGKREHLACSGSPVRKRPLIAVSKPCEYCFLCSIVTGVLVHD